jgi:hypothetical protein
MQKRDEEILRMRDQVGLSYSKISEHLNVLGMGMSENSINKRYLLLKKQGEMAPTTADALVSTLTEGDLTSTGVVSEAVLRQKHDMFFIIQNRLKQIPKGFYMEESQLLKDLGLYGKPRYKDALARVEKDYRGKVDGSIYYGHPESIRKLKNEGVLQ